MRWHPSAIAVTFLTVALLASSSHADQERFRQPFDLDPDTVALFHFDEAGAVHGSASHNAASGEPDGVVKGAALWSPIDHPAGNAAFGGSLLLVDEGAAMTWKDSPRADLPGTYTIEFWIRPANVASGMIVGQTYPRSPGSQRLSHVTSVSRGRIVHRNAEGSGDSGVGNSAWIVTTLPVLGPGKWTHVAVVNDEPGGRLEIFVDGAPALTTRHEDGANRDAQPHDPKDIAGDFAVGAGLYENPAKSFVGALDELRVSNVARYPLEITRAIRGKRVLLLDDLYVAETENLERVLHQPRKHKNNPILKREKPWEKWVADAGQILYDPKARLYKRWYRTFASMGTETYSDRGAEIFHCYATSKDGLSWERPNLSLVEFRGSRDNNIIPTLYHVIPRHHEPDAEKQFAGLQGRGGENLFYSDDGLNWEPHPDNPVARGPSFGMTALFYDPIRKRYAAYGQGWVRLPRPGEPNRGSRIVSGRFSEDLVHWTVPQPVLLPTPEDPEGFEFYAMGGYIDGGDLYIGLPWAYRSSHGPGNDPPHPRQYGPIETELAVSRNGVHWTRVVPREAFVPLGKKGEWDSGMILTGSPVRMGDELYFYYSAWNGDHGKKKRKAAGGLAILTRDRYVSFKPQESSRSGRLTTAPLEMHGGQLWVNADATGGEIRLSLRTVNGDEVPGYGLAGSVSLVGDSLEHQVRWQENARLPSEGIFIIEFKLSGRAHLYGFGSRG